jgi:hypothetical protein
LALRLVVFLPAAAFFLVAFFAFFAFFAIVLLPCEG